jgi:hypothetical protein
MPAKKRPGMTGVYFEIADEDLAALEKLAASLPLGGKADHLRLAVKRHLANPPTVEVGALPPLPKPAPAPPRKRRKAP